MKTPDSALEKAKAKQIDQVIKSYLEDTPKKIRELRDMRIPSAVDRPLTKLDLAELTDVGPQNVGKIEKDYGEPHSLNASIKFLIKIAVIFDMDLNYLVGLTDKPIRLSKLHKKSEADPKTLDDLLNINIEMLTELKKR